MARIGRVTGTVLKGRRITITLEPKIDDEISKNIGKGKRYATKSHCLNYLAAKEFGLVE